jgi:hypothetical protein
VTHAETVAVHPNGAIFKLGKNPPTTFENSQMLIRHPLYASLFLLLVILGCNTSLAVPFHDQTSKVAILLRPSVWRELSPEISAYMEDVSTSEQVEFELIQQDFDSPEQVRRLLRTLWEKKGIEGAILIGAIPMHRFFMHEHANPNPLFYEDFSLEYRDADGDGAAESYSGKPDVKIWIANMRASEKATEDELEGLRHYFNKIKRFRAGEIVYQKQAIIITDAELGLRDEETKLGRVLFGQSGVDLLATPKNSLSNFRSAFRDKAYAICTMGVHSDWAGQELEEGELSASEIKNMTTGAILTLNHGCFAGNWCVSEKEGTGLSTAQSWVFGSGVGISVIANVRSGCIYGYAKLCKSLRMGDRLGRAYLAAKSEGELEMHREYPDGSIVSGVLLFGDPFLKFNQ